MGRQLERTFKLDVAPTNVGTEGNKLSFFQAKRLKTTEHLGALKHLRWRHLRGQARQRDDRINRRKLPPLGTSPVEHNVAIEETAHFIGDRFVEVAPLEKNRVECSN